MNNLCPHSVGQRLWFGRTPSAGSRALGHDYKGEREHKAQQQQEPRVKVEGDRIIVEREVELETIWNVRRIALDPRVYILYAYAQKYLGYPGSLGEFVSDCTILFFKERGIEVMLKLPEAS
jgi:hypothetical protein